MSHKIFKALGCNIKQERHKQKLTQEQLAESAGISAAFLSLIENGHKVPSLETVCQIASCLGTPIESLFQDNYKSQSKVEAQIEILLQDNTEKEKRFLLNIMKLIAINLKNERLF